ncbi:uncharacterized protein [Dermacentor albipictus]|uniref:uncharacterized protein isoform X3 n=1 Tax=Dermacentor albipictus TaxID=60249 RepID=UPI0038FCE19E
MHFQPCFSKADQKHQKRLTRTAPAACGCAVGSIIVRAHLRHHRSICCSVPPKQSSWYIIASLCRRHQPAPTTSFYCKQHARILLQGAAGANDDEMTEEDDDRRCSCARSPSSNAPCRYLQCQCKVGRRFLRAGHQPCLNHRPPTTPSSSHNRATQVLFPALTRPTSKTGFNFTNGRKASLPGTRAHTDAVEHEGIH